MAWSHCAKKVFICVTEIVRHEGIFFIFRHED